MYVISTIDELVTALGGPSELGSVLGISQEAVSNWAARGSIPGGWHVRLLSMCMRNNILVNPSVFQLTPSDVVGIDGFVIPLARRAELARH